MTRNTKEVNNRAFVLVMPENQMCEGDELYTNKQANGEHRLTALDNVASNTNRSYYTKLTTEAQPLSDVACGAS